jgi:hypothetical protein
LNKEEEVIDSSANFFQKTLDLLKNGKLDEQGLFNICEIGGKKLSSVKVRINQMLKDEGSDKTLNLFLKKERKIKETNNLHNNYLFDKINQLDV